MLRTHHWEQQQSVERRVLNIVVFEHCFERFVRNTVCQNIVLSFPHRGGVNHAPNDACIEQVVRNCLFTRQVSNGAFDTFGATGNVQCVERCGRISHLATEPLGQTQYDTTSCKRFVNTCEHDKSCWNSCDAMSVRGSARGLRVILYGAMPPPDMLVGSQRFGLDLDLWSLGCLAAELFLREPLFQQSGKELIEGSFLDAQFAFVGTHPTFTENFYGRDSRRLPAKARPEWLPTRMRGLLATVGRFRATNPAVAPQRTTDGCISQLTLVRELARPLRSACGGRKGTKGARLH